MGTDLPVIKDAAIVGAGYVCGANKPDTHLIGVEPGRDFPFEEMDVRSVEAGDLAPGGHPIEIEPAIEVGQIFKLGHPLLGAARRATTWTRTAPSGRS